jgi:hypothetical protein
METIGYTAAVVIGITLGLMGGGGSILTVPTLVYLFDEPASKATGDSLFIVGATAAIGAGLMARRGLVVGRAVLGFALPDSLADVAEDDCAEQEELLSIAIGIWLKRHKKNWGDDTPFPSTPNADPGPAEWDPEDEESLARLYPRLFAKFW